MEATREFLQGCPAIKDAPPFPAKAGNLSSGDASPDEIQAAMLAGSRDYLLKPFTIQQFGEMIDRLNQPRFSAKETFDHGQLPFHVPFPGNANPPA